MYTKKELTEQIKGLGIKSDDVITIHMSLKSIGEIEKGDKTTAEIFIEAAKEAVPDGLLVIPSHTYANIREVPVFNIRETMPCIGAVPTVAVKMANEAYDKGDKTCVRSFHVSHSVVAFGERAYEFTRDDSRAKTPMPSFGSYAKLKEYNAKILLIGVDFSSNTFIHMIDEYTAPEKLSPEYPITGIDYDGKEYQRYAKNCSERAALYPQYQPFLDKEDALSYGKIGDANVIVCDAKKMFEIIVKMKKTGFKLQE